MRQLKSLLFLFIIAVLTSCNPIGKITKYQSNAESFLATNDYTSAFNAYQQAYSIYQTKNISIPSDFLIKAANTGINASQYATVEKWISDYMMQNDSFITEGTIILADIYDHTDAVNKKTELFKTWEEKTGMNDNSLIGRYYLHNVAIQDYLKANQLYDKIDTPSDHITETQISVLDSVSTTDKVRLFCQTTLKQKIDFIPAMEWLAIYHYNKADEKYEYEMGKYKKNKNYTQYAYLRRELKKVSADYRKAKSYFLKLHENEPENKTYIKYLKNCYLRLDLNEEAKKMDKLL